MTADKRTSRRPAHSRARRALHRRGRWLLEGLSRCGSLRQVRRRLLERVSAEFALRSRQKLAEHVRVRAHECFLSLTTALQARTDERTGFSMAQALWDVAAGKPRADLSPAFFAEVIHWMEALRGRSRFSLLTKRPAAAGLTGRRAAQARSRQLDHLWQLVEGRMSRFPHGLEPSVQARRRRRRLAVLKALGGRAGDWDDWTWHVANVLTDPARLARAVPLSAEEAAAVDKACDGGVPFGVTPYYASLMDEQGQADRAIRAQVLPSRGYAEFMAAHRQDRRQFCDFMLESDTSPIDLVTRRYPAIAIIKPYNTCPQICVYCQRNWEIDSAMSPTAFAGWKKVNKAIDWIASRPAIKEVLVTGGDPMAMDDNSLERILGRLSRIDHVDMIRIGTRTPVTLPMRITADLAAMLGSFRQPGRRELAVVTHVEHPYEITPALAAAVDRLRRAGLAVFNQQVYTFFVSRRFETALLRLLLRRVGIDPYYTFAPKGKGETGDYRVPLARLLQERAEEARLLPGLRRTDEPVYNIPGLGKNYLRAGQHHELLTVRGDGARVYEFHPWEKNIVPRGSSLVVDVPILEYLQRLQDIGESPADYDSIWYYF